MMPSPNHRALTLGGSLFTPTLPSIPFPVITLQGLDNFFLHEDDPTSLDSLCFSSDCLEEIESLLTDPPSDRPKAPKVKRHRPGPEPRNDRLHVWNIVLGWDEATFRLLSH